MNNYIKYKLLNDESLKDYIFYRTLKIVKKKNKILSEEYQDETALICIWIEHFIFNINSKYSDKYSNKINYELFKKHVNRVNDTAYKGFFNNFYE